MISVVIPLYNKEKYIVNTLESVLAQTYWSSDECRGSSGEVIIVNDGSTDSSKEVVEKWILNVNARQSTINHPLIPFRLVNKENGGVSSARNAGIEAAKGEYIAFLDGDDEWEPEFLQASFDLIQRYPTSVLYVIGSGEMYQGKKIGDESDMMDGLCECVWHKSPCFSSSACLVKRDALLQIGGFDERMAYGEDLDVWWRLALIGSVACEKRVLSWYLTDVEDSAMNKPKPLEKHIPYYIEKYQEARNENAAFRKFFDREMAYRLYPYLFDKQYCKEAKRLAKQLDYSQLKRSIRFRMSYPHVYRMYERLKNRIHAHS